MRSRNTEETVRELNEKSKAAGISAEYKAAEINTNGKLSRELAGAVTQADFARERNRIIFGDAALRNSPAQKDDSKLLNTQTTPKAEETENSPDFHQSARQLAQSQFLTETTKEFTDSNDSSYMKDEYIFPADYNSGTESHVSVQDKHGTGTRHNAEIAAADSPAGNDADIIGESLFYKENTPSLSARTEAVHHTEDTRFNAADRAVRKSFTENELAYSSTANSADNALSNGSRAAHTVQVTGADRNAAAKTEPSYTSVQGSSGKKAGRNSSQPREDISGRTKPTLTPEQEEAARLERMNANYEHDKAVLAKADPLFARNHFWDVGHAEGSGEVADRDLAKLAQIKIEEEKNRLLDGGHFNEY